MKRAINFIVGFTIGGLIGATVVMLITPTSGNELRAQFQARIAELQEEIKTAAASRRAELEEQLAALRKP